MRVTVTTQTQLDQAIARKESEVCINAPADEWLTLWSSGSSSVEARGSSSVDARDSSRVEARDSSRVVARGSSRVEASTYVAVHLWSTKVTLSGSGHIIDMTTLDFDDPQQWCDYKGVTVRTRKRIITEDGMKVGCDVKVAILYKAVHDDWCTDRGPQWTYKPGAIVTADDYTTDRECGGGLHLCPTPSGSRGYLSTATRFVACEADLADLIPLDDKAKVRSVRVLYEVDEWGDRIEETA